MDENNLISFHSLQLQEWPWICIHAFWHSFVPAFGEGCAGSEKSKREWTHKTHLPPCAGLCFLALLHWVGVQLRGSCCLPAGLPNNLREWLTEKLVGTHPKFPLVIFAWCPWYKPSIWYQTIVLHCWNSHLPPSILLHPWRAKAPAKNHNTSQQGLCENRTKKINPCLNELIAQMN